MVFQISFSKVIKPKKNDKIMLNVSTVEKHHDIEGAQLSKTCCQLLKTKTQTIIWQFV